MSEHKCVGRVYAGHYIGSHTCNKTARYEHNGKWYCKTHHPPTVEEKRRAQAAKWEAKFDAERAQRAQHHREDAEMQRRAAAYDGLLEALKEIVDAADGAGWEQLDPSFKKARAAIAKATGEPA